MGDVIERAKPVILNQVSESIRDSESARIELIKMLKINSPIIIKSGVEFKGHLGSGRSSNVDLVKLRNGDSDIDAARKVYRGDIRYEEEGIRAKAIHDQKVWFDFYTSGLPVPHFSKVDLRRGNPNYLSVYMENMEQKDSRLSTCHDPEYGYLKIRWISSKENSKLIQDMAKDYAKITNLGYVNSYVDFWFFYKKGETRERVIMDYTGFKKFPLDFPENSREKTNFDTMFKSSTKRLILGFKSSRESNLFLNTFIENCKNPHGKEIASELKSVGLYHSIIREVGRIKDQMARGYHSSQWQ